MARAAARAWMAAVLVAIALLVAGAGARASEPVVVAAEIGEVPLGKHVDWLEDPDGKLTLDDVRRADVAARFRPSTWDAPNFGFSTSTYWFRFDLTNPSSASFSELLEVSYPALSSVQLFTPRPDGSFEAHVTGARLPFSSRDVPHHNFVFRVPVEPGTRAFYLRVAAQGAVQVPITLWSPAAFFESDAPREIASGFLFGLLFVMGTYNLFLFFAVRDRSYVYYAGYVFFFLVMRATIDGQLIAHVWPAWPRWNEQFFEISLTSVGLMMSVFTRQFLDLRATLPRWHRFLGFTCWVFACGTVATLFLPYHVVMLIMASSGLFLAPGIFAAAVRAWLHGVKAARYYVLAWTVLIFGTTSYMLQKVGIAPHNFLTEHGWDVGSALEVILISFALADRLNQLKADKEEAQAEALVLQRDANENLRREVVEQTRELRDQAARLVELDRQKTHFFQNVSHELRTPLTLILNPLDEMTREPAFAGERRIDVAMKNARRLLRLVNQLLDFQKLAAGKREMRLEPIDVTAFAKSCGEYFAPACGAQGIAFGVRTEGDAVVVRAEADALEKIVFNFLANALKYTPRGKAIELFVEVKDGRARVGVKDEGPGISDEGKARLFQLFSQVDGGKPKDGSGLALANEGTGLGLALAKELAEAMGGIAGVESRLGEGATFFVELPRVDAPAVEAKPTGRAMADVAVARASDRPASPSRTMPAQEPSGDGARVLVVDDLADMRDLVARTLARHGYRVTTASSAREALDAMAARGKPDLVVSDWMMPGMSGPELVTAMRADAELRAVPVVLLTAKSDEESRLAGTEIGADAFLGKPFNESELVSTVRNLVHLKERERDVERLNRHIAENVLKRYLPGELVDDILSGKTSVDVEPETVQATILFGDLAGFTRTSAKLRAAKMARLLNEYLSRMNDVVFAHGGTVDKFMGDGIMVIFGAPVRLEAKEQVRRAAHCAIAMQRAMAELNARWATEGLPPIPLRIGVHHGPVVVGNFGDARRSDYTAIGPTVNLASRIEGVCPEGGVLVSGEVYDFLPEKMAEDAGAMELKGVDGVVRCFRLVLGAVSESSLFLH